MTNQEYLIAALNDEFDDCGASWESVVYYNIRCPYYDGDPRCKCTVAEINRETCVDCKREWLESEVDE